MKHEPLRGKKIDYPIGMKWSKGTLPGIPVEEIKSAVAGLRAGIEKMIEEQHQYPAMPEIGIKKPFVQCPKDGGEMCSCDDLKEVISKIDKWLGVEE